jgi:tryptophanyl-tRNA synthetase
MRYLSGIQPSGTLHLGNYFGAMRQHVERQREHDCYYFIADYHALTSVHEAARLRALVREVALDYLAVGLDPERVAFFRQSDVPEVTELAWILSTVTGMGLLERCHSFKDKIAKGLEASHGLFAYPVLMAADILIYDSQRVPVGQDQVQHVEVTRDIAQRFNARYGATLVVPEGEVHAETAVVPGTDGKKMSKSYGNTIPLFAAPKELKKTIMSIPTDSLPVEAPKDPDQSLIFQLYKLVASPAEVEALAARFRAGGMGYGEAKQALLEKVQAYFDPYRRRREALAARPGEVDEALRRGALKARATAGAVMERVRHAVGLR